MLEIMTVADVAIPANVSPDYTIAIVIAIIGGLATLIAAIISGFFSGVKGAANAAQAFIDKYDQKVEKLSETVEHLKKERIEKLEITINEHLNKDQTQGIQTALDFMRGMSMKMDNKLDRLSDGNARVETRLDGHDKWMQNMNESVQKLQDK